MDKDYPYELYFGIVGYLDNDLDGIIKQLEKILKKVISKLIFLHFYSNTIKRRLPKINFG